MGRNKEYYENKIGEANNNFYGSKMTIIEFNSCHDIVVEYENGFKQKTRYSEFKSGKVKSPYDKRVFGVGYHGIGDYKVSINQKHTMHYNYWYDMLKRCYDEDYNNKHKSYSNKYVCEEWHNFQNFAKWVDANYYNIDTEDRIELDKDILIKGNEVYSPETCVFIPRILNTLFVKNDARRGEYPVGVTKVSKYNRYIARVSKNRNEKVIREVVGRFNTPYEAFLSYKQAKEKYIKQVADEYKDKIPKKLYDAMYNYQVEITD